MGGQIGNERRQAPVTAAPAVTNNNNAIDIELVLGQLEALHGRIKAMEGDTSAAVKAAAEVAEAAAKKAASAIEMAEGSATKVAALEDAVKALREANSLAEKTWWQRNVTEASWLRRAAWGTVAVAAAAAAIWGVVVVIRRYKANQAAALPEVTVGI